MNFPTGSAAEPAAERDQEESLHLVDDGIDCATKLNVHFRLYQAVQFGTLLGHQCLTVKQEYQAQDFYPNSA